MSVTNIIGVNYSNTFQSLPIADTDAASQIQALGARSVKLFNYTQTSFLDQARASGLSVVVAVPNGEIENLYNNHTSALTSVLASYTDVITTVCIGNEPLGSWQPPDYATYLPKAVSNTWAAIRARDWDLRVTVPFNYSIMGTSWPPSSGSFSSGLVDTLTNVCSVLAASESPFMINMYPYLDHANDHQNIPLDYCLFTKTSPQFTDPVWKLDYYNIFDSAYDAVIQALASIGYASLPVVIGECGWPTDGGHAASVSNAKTFVSNLIAHCNGGGSPKNPGVQFPCYLFEMYDEDKKPAQPGPFETHWGLFYEQCGKGVAKFPARL